MSKNILQTLAEINGGAFADECSATLSELVGEVRRTGGKGSITITLDIKSAKGNQSVTVDPGIKSKVPTLDRPIEFFFVGKDNSLLRDHPDQQKLPLRSTDAEVDPDTGEIIEPNAA